MLQAVLALDMVSSTRIRASVGDVVFETIRARMERDLALLVEERGGHVLAGTGDGAEVALPSATDAVETAVALQRAVVRARAVWRTDPEVSLRVGVAVGAGDEVRALARETAAGAGGDGILLAAGVAEMAGSWLDADVRAGMEPRADGRVRVVWEPTSLGAEVGLPPGVDAAGLVGRAELRAALAGAATGAGDDGTAARVAVVLAGEPGIGKTMLAGAVAADVVASGGTVLWGRCTDPPTGAVQPVVEALDRFLGAAPLAVSWLGPDGHDLARLSDVLHARLGAPDLVRLDPETARLRAVRAAVDWLATLAAHAPVLLVVDDVQWATPTTRDVLLRLAAGAPAGLTLLLTRRTTTDDANLDGWLAELGREMDLRVETVEPLRAGDVADLARASADDALDDGAVAWIDEVARGNPFFVEQLARHLAGRTDTSAAIPSGLRQTIEGRLAALGREADEVVRTAAVLGDEFDAVVLLELLDDDLVERGLDEAVRAGVVKELDPRALRYRFAHGITRQVAIDGVGALRRARIHARIHQVLDRLPEPTRSARSPERAHHALAAHQLVGLDAVVADALAASAHLRRTLAPADAADLLRRSLEVVADDPRRRAALLVELADAWQDAADGRRLEASSTAVPLARELGDGALVARAVLARSRGSFSRALHVDAQEVELLDTALAMVPAERPALRARLLSQRSMELAFAPDRTAHDRDAAAAIAAARTSGDPRVLGLVLAGRLWNLAHPAAHRQQIQAELDEVATATGDPELRFWADFHGVFTAVQDGDGETAGRRTAAAEAQAEALARPGVRWTVLHATWLVSLMRGEWERARAALEEQAGLAARMGGLDAETAREAQVALLAMDTTEPEVGRAQLRPFAPHAALLPDHVVCTVARRAAELGVLELAAPLVERAHAVDLVGPPEKQAHLYDGVQLLEAALLVGRDDVAEALVPRMAARATEHAWIVFAAAGSPHRPLGLAAARAGDLERAVEHLELAVAADDRACSVVWGVRSRLDLAEVVADADPTRATVLLAEAVDTIERVGLPVLAERAGRLLERTGVTLPDRVPARPAGLSGDGTPGSAPATP